MKKFIILTTILIFYLVAVETMLTVLNVKKVKNGFEYFISRTFNNEEWERAQEMLENFREIGQRTFRKKDTLLYLYKPFSTKHYTINKHGFRGDPITPAAKNEIRIIAAGASVMWGIFVPDDETIPALIEQKINRKYGHTGYNFTLWNLSVEAFDFQRIFALTRHFYKDISPDGMFFYSGYADVLYTSVDGYKKHEPFEDNGPTTHTIFDMRETTWLAKLTMGTRVGNLILNEFYTPTDFYPDFRTGTVRNPEKRKEQLNTFAKSYVEGFYNDVKKATSFYEKRELPTLFYFSPALIFKTPKSRDEKLFLELYRKSFPLFNYYAKRCINKVFERDRKEKDLFISLLDIFEGEKDSIFWDNVHINPRGNKIIADEIFSDMEKRGFIQKLIDRKEKKTDL